MGKKPLHFGEFLLKKGLISKGDILVARHIQQQANKQIGELAVRQRMLNAQKVQEILQQQKTSRRKFGEVAIDLKILTRQQVKDLLEYQKKHNFLIGEIFSYEGKLSRTTLEEEIEEFARFRESKESASTPEEQEA